jgi:hypothetical protein
VKNEPFLGLELIFTRSDYLERNFYNKILIVFILDLLTDIKFIKLNVLIHFRGSITFEVQSYKVWSLSKFGHSMFGPLRDWVLFEVRSFEVRSLSRFGHSRFGPF